jgi:hypothetical protein
MLLSAANVGLAKYVKATETQLQEVNFAWFDLISNIHGLFPSSRHVNLFLSSANDKTAGAQLCTLGLHNFNT